MVVGDGNLGRLNRLPELTEISDRGTQSHYPSRSLQNGSDLLVTRMYVIQ